jgi:anti-sigma B factor antagonist
VPPDSSDPTDSTFAISIRRLTPERTTVLVEGELDLSSADQLKQALLDELADGHAVVLDLGGVRFIDSTGLSAIISAVQRSAEIELAFELRPELQPQVQRLMELTGVIPMFTFVN